MKVSKTWTLVPFEPVPNIKVSVSLEADFPQLSLSYRVEGPMAVTLGTGASTSPHYNAELWKKSCFELFAKDPNSPAYYEWNFSPNCDAFGFFAFEDYRKRSSADNWVGSPLSLHSERRQSDLYIHRVQLDLSISPRLAWCWINRMPIALHPTVILENQGFWAPKHPATKPDFHNAQAYSPFLLLP